MRSEETTLDQAVVLLGAPGAGKGTIAKRLVRHVGLVHLSTGDQIRKEMIPPASAIGKLCHPYMEKGLFVPDELAVQIADSLLAGRPPGSTVILDGFPRNVAQIPLMDDLFARHALSCLGAFHIQADEEELKARLAGRRICPSCGLLSHISMLDPRMPDRCPVCGHTLLVRSDDRPGLISARMRSYREQTTPMVEAFRERGKLIELPIGMTHDAIVDSILTRLKT